MTCGGCGTDNRPEARFCRRCGTALAPACPGCGAAVEAGDVFCQQCGTALTPAASAAPAPAPPVAERRMCSVLFVDLVGFTPLSEGRDPEEVRELLSQYFERSRVVIGRYGGVVEKFIGDAVMAIWGAPAAAEGDTERAVRAALEVVDAVAVLGAEAGAGGLAARAGVVTGEVAVTLGATGEGMVAGDAVNTAARIQAAATGGTVLVDEATRRLASSSIVFADAGAHELKGKAESQQLWRAVRVVSSVGGVQRADGLEAPLVGRDTELRALKEALHFCAERRVARMVWVAGAAGVGKSRLGWELEKYVDGLAEVILWHRGRCLSYGDGVAFWALAEAIRQRFGIAEEDPTAVAGSKLAEGLARFVPDDGERAYVGARLARLLGVPTEGGVLAREELFAGWRLFFERLADVAPVALVIEDAQHADKDLLDFLDHLVDWSRGAAITVVVLSRGEGERAGRNRSVLWLEPLDEASTIALLEGLVPGLPTEAVDAIAAQAEGVPLFAVESVRALIDRGAVAADDAGSYRLVGELGALAVPDSLHGLLASRLDALEPAVRALVADAAVLGGSFPAEALVAVSGQSESEVRGGLAELVRREILEVSADPLSPQRGAYRFGQTMLRHVAYETLSRRDRKSRHLAVAAHLRATFADDGEEVMDVVARHYLDALDAVPDDGDVDELHTLAVGSLARAGERAERAGAPGRAAASFQAAAELAETQGDERAAAGWWERAAKAWHTDARYDAALDAAEQARTRYEQLGEVRAAARAHAAAGLGLDFSGRGREALDRYQAALAVLRIDPDADTVLVLVRLAGTETFTGTGDAAATIAEALALAQGLDVDDGLLAYALAIDGLVGARSNRRAEAAANYREAARLAERAGDTNRLSLAEVNLSGLLVAWEPAEAIAHATVAAGHARRTGGRHGLAIAAVNLAAAAMLAGDWDTAQHELGEQADTDGIADLAYVTGARAWLAALRGDTATAEDLLGEIAGLADSDDTQEQELVAVGKVLVSLANSDHAATLAQARVVLDHTPTLGWGNEHTVLVWPPAARAAHSLDNRAVTEELLTLLDGVPPGHLPPVLRAERDLARARLAAGAGEPDADTAMADAVGAVRRAGSPWHLGHALVDHAGELAAWGRNEDAAAALAEAAAIASRLDAAPLARRTAQAGASVPTAPS